ncbi:hypothetical protein [Mycobacterium sp. 050134]
MTERHDDGHDHITDDTERKPKGDAAPVQGEAPFPPLAGKPRPPIGN